MATLENKPTHQQIAASQTKLRSPLETLRKYIRAYVSLEGVGFFLTFLFLWFWIGLLLDFGFFFKLLGFDYAQALPFTSPTGRILRVGILGGLLAWLVTKLLFIVVLRLFRDFSDPSLALLLERRYPEELGDRLITAVELSDPEKAATQGYSVVMVEETIVEAAKRVDKLPVKDVFDWNRLLRTGLLVLLLSVVAYIAVVGLFHQFRLYQPNRSDLSGFNRFHDVAAIWAKRNILLQDTPWPREEQLVVLEPTADPLRIGYNQGRTNVRYRALKYVVADSSVSEGWRSLLVKKDLLDSRIKLVEGSVPLPPEDWKGKYTEDGDLSLDEIELAYERLPIRFKAPESGAVWSIRELREGGEGYRPLRWSEIRKNTQFGTTVPGLNAAWDPQALAGIIGSATGLPDMAALTAAVNVGSSAETVNLSVDQVLATLETLEALKKGQKIEDPTLRDELIPDVRAVFDRLDRVEQMRDLVVRVNAYLQQPALSQVARILTLPDQADLVSTLRNNDFKVPLSRSRDTNEFTGSIDLPDRSDVIYYSLRTEGYSTASRRIDIIGPPQLVELNTEEFQPAYLFYRWGKGVPKYEANGKIRKIRTVIDGKEQDIDEEESNVAPEDLAGRKQRIDGKDRLNAGAPVSRLDVPAGSDLKITARAERPLSAVRLAQGKGPKLPENLVIGGPDSTDTFTLTFPNIRTDANFTIEMTDSDGVVGSRNVLIKVLEDSPPDLPDIKPSAILRKNKEGQILVTPEARIPFEGQILDDRGLSSIRYTYTVERVELIPRVNEAVLGLYLAAFGSGPIRGTIPLTTIPLYLEALGRNATAEAERAASVKVARLPNLFGFVDSVKNSGLEKDPFLSRTQIDELLNQPVGLPYRPMTRKYDLTADKFKEGEGRQLTERNDFPVREARYDNNPLKSPGGSNTQQRFKLQIWVEGADNDVEGARDRNGLPVPHVTTSKDRFSFLVIDASDLLLEINKSEEALNFRLIQLSRGVEGGKSWEYDSLSKMESDLSNDLVQLAGANIKNAEVRQMAGRIRAMKALMAKGQAYCQTVLGEYGLLMLEMELNRISEDELVKKRRDVIVPLGKVINVAFPRTEDALNTFDRALVAAGSGEATEPPAPAALAAAKAQSLIAQTALRDLHTELEAVIQALEQVANLAKEIEKLKRLAEKKQAESELYDRIRRWIEERDLRALEGLGITPPPKPKP